MFTTDSTTTDAATATDAAPALAAIGPEYYARQVDAP